MMAIRNEARVSRCLTVMALLCCFAYVPVVSGQGEWQQVALPPFVEYLTALTPGRDYLYAAMRDSSGSHLGLHRTPLETPGTWISLGLEGEEIRDVVAATNSDSVLLVAVSGDPNLFWSSDAGQTWEPRDLGVSHPLIITLGWNSVYPGYTYASAWSQADGIGIYASSDFGQGWQYSAICGPGCVGSGMMGFAVPRDGGSLAWSVGYTGYWESIPYKTTDGGLTWSRLDMAVYPDIYPVDLDVSARDPEEFYLLGPETALRFLNDDYVGYFYPPFGHHANIGLEAPAWNPDVLYATGILGSGLLGVASSELPWDSWTSIRQGLPDSTFPSPEYNWEKFHFTAAPSRPYLFLGAWGIGLWVRDLSDAAAVADFGTGDPRRLSLSVPWPNPSSGCFVTRLVGDYRVTAIFEVLNRFS